MAVRAWSWTRIDGRNVLAVPTQTEIRLYDSDDFILLSRLSPSGHQSPVAFVRWSSYHGKLASLSSELLLVHTPQRDPSERGRVVFAPVCRLRLDTAIGSIRGLAFSRSADELLFCGPEAGVGKLDVRTQSYSGEEANVVWKAQEESCDLAKYSPSAFVFATLKTTDKYVKVWRMQKKLGQPDATQKLQRVEKLTHPQSVVYFSWKPATTQWHSALETDGTRKAQWFEPARILLTCTATRVVRLWTEKQNGDQVVHFEPVLVFEPTVPIDNVRWVMSKNRNISDENFQVVNDAQDNHADWVSGVDPSGILRLWRVVGLLSATPVVEETPLQIQVNGEDDRHHSKNVVNVAVPLGEVCVMAYFSQNFFGMPSKLGIVLQRADHIMMSFHVAVGDGDRPSQILKKSWYRSHLGSISALSAHPSLPLIASVDAHPSDHDGTRRNEILVYWVSFSAFSAESRLIPSGVLPCEQDSGEVLCVQWVPTLHFEATPLLLVAFKSGTIDVYGRSARSNIAVISSPKVQPIPNRQHRKLTRSPSLSPWTFYDYATGDSGYEYEVAFEKPSNVELGIQLEERMGKLIVSQNSSTNKYLSEVVEGDELVGMNNKSVVGKDVNEVFALISMIPCDESVLLRLRAACVQNVQGITGAPVDEATSSSKSQAPFQPGLSKNDGNGLEFSEPSVEDYASDLRRDFLSSLDIQNPQSPRSTDSVVHAGAVSMYGGWKRLLHTKVASKLSVLCVCPAYADDGEYVPDSVIIFGITSLPGNLCAWKGVGAGGYLSFELVPLQIQDPVINKRNNITSIAGERDYRQRAFSSNKVQARNSLNSLLFVGDATGNIEHWRCQIVGDVIHFTMMSSHPVCCSTAPPSSNGNQNREPSGSFCRRGYVSADQLEDFRQIGDSFTVVGDGISHIEVDDPNRLAVLHADRPEELHVLEAESGLGILRLEDFIPSNGRGHILGFCWCSSHVEFNVDALAVRYESAIVIYQYDTNVHRWSQVGDDIVSPQPLFDCTRDSSALLIGGGHLKNLRRYQPSFQPISNEMPVVIGKWDEPGSILQYSMDWKAAESPQKLPVWHPYVLLTTMFGMHARVGEKDTSLAGDRASYEFSRAFKDATQMLKLLAKVMEDEPSARASAASGVLSYSGHVRSTNTEKSSASGCARMLEPVGRYSTSIHRSDKIDKAENLFAAPMIRSSQTRYDFDETESSSAEADQRTLLSTEAATILTAIDYMLLGKAHAFQANAAVLFASFNEEHFLEMKALLNFVDAIQSLGFDLDASAADLGAKRFFSMNLFSKSVRSVVLAHTGGTSDDSSSNLQNGDADPFSGKSKWKNSYSERDSCMWLPSLEETPSSGLLWALHSDAQQFLWEHCILPNMQWDDIRPLWVGLWIKDVKDLRGIVERFAKVSYARTKDAMDVCLLYVALGKKKVLSALAKLTQSESNQTLSSFLDNDFSDKRWSTAAIKNAYSLLSKKKYETAAAFFLLCEPPRLQDAIRVLAVRLGDPSLALVIARLVEYNMDDKLQHDFATSQAGITPAGDVTKQLLKQDVIPLFRRKFEVWLESCALWWLEEFEQAWAVLLPQFQDVDVFGVDETTLPTKNNLVSSVMRATHFYINLTSLTVYFQHLHSNVNSSLLRWAKKKMHQQAFPDVPVSPATTSSSKRRLQLASPADIEHAFSFSAYVCKRNGLSDTALVEMLQARHLVNLHARFEISTIEKENLMLLSEEELSSVSESPTSPRFQSSPQSLRRGSKLACLTSPVTSTAKQAAWSRSPRRMSFLDEFSLPHIDPLVTAKKAFRHRSNSVSVSRALESDSEKSIPTAPWLKAQIADVECRRWASSAFVGKMIGIRVAREMISHFRSELDMWFRHGDASDSPTNSMTMSTSPGQHHFHRVTLHREFLDKLCTPLSEQFQVDRKYVYEAALAVMHPHAYLHIVEVCFLLSELGRVSTLRKWVEYVSLSMLHSCSTFASCSIAEDVYRDWEGLTIQLCFILNLDAQGQISIPARVIAHISVAVRTGIIFLGWARERTDIVRLAVSLPFYTSSTVNDPSTGEPGPSLSSFAFEKNLRLLCRLLQRPAGSASELRKTRIIEGNLGYTFLGTVAARQLGDENISLLSWGGMENAETQNQFKIRKMYTLILMVSVLRTLYARATVFLTTSQDGIDADDGVVEADIASSLFTPQKLWKAQGEGPLEGLKRWYALIESHLRCEFDYSVKEVPCLCGLYGLDTAAFEEAAATDLDVKQTECQHKSSSDGNGEEDAPIDNPESDSKNDVHIAAPVKSTESTEDEGSDNLQAFLHEIGMRFEQHTSLASASDDYVLLLMQHAGFGVRTTLRRFRVDPRVYVKSFVLRDAFSWFASHQIFKSDSKVDTSAHIQVFLSRCCKQRKLRLLVAHRGEDTQMFPMDRHQEHPHVDSEASSAASTSSEVPAPQVRLQSAAFGSEPNDEPPPDSFYLQSMMFVDPWEVEAEGNVRRYMYNAQHPLHVELGWDRLSLICPETCDGIVDSVFEDPDLVAMWKSTGGEGWLVTAITQYRLDGLHSYRTLHQHIHRGLAGKEEPKIPLLVEIYSRSQRNAMFQEAGLPHRFVGVITVELVEAKDLISCSWVGHWSNAYVFIELAHAKSKLRDTAEEWSLQTYRSPVGEGGVNPHWSAEDSKFVFRFAIPTHGRHTTRPTRGVQFCNGASGVNSHRVDAQDSRVASQIWNAEINDENHTAVDALENLLPSVFSGPPAKLNCTVYQKNKVLSHQFMGRTQVSLDELTSGNPMDCWLPLEETASGSLHVRISLSFQLMCSSMAGQPESGLR